MGPQKGPWRPPWELLFEEEAALTCTRLLYALLLRGNSAQLSSVGHIALRAAPFGALLLYESLLSEQHLPANFCSSSLYSPSSTYRRTPALGVIAFRCESCTNVRSLTLRVMFGKHNLGQPQLVRVLLFGQHLPAHSRPTSHYSLGST